MIANTFAQKQNKFEKNNPNCNLPISLKVSKAATILMDSYNKLLNPTASNLCTSSNGTITSFGTMPLPYYVGSTNVGSVSFASFIEAGNLLRTIFGAVASNYEYYGACVPNPLIWDADISSGNHVFAAKLVTIPNFFAAGANADFLNTTAVNITDIKSFDCIKLEDANGYAAVTETKSYLNPYSSKGIIVLITLKTGVKQYCYLINNYDTSGTLKWKE